MFVFSPNIIRPIFEFRKHNSVFHNHMSITCGINQTLKKIYNNESIKLKFLLHITSLVFFSDRLT